MTSLYWIRAGGYDGHGWETVVGIRGIHDRTNASIRELLEAIRDETAMGANSFPASPEASAHRHAAAALATLDAAHRADAHDHGDGLVVIPDTPRTDDDA